MISIIMRVLVKAIVQRPRTPAEPLWNTRGSDEREDQRVGDGVLLKARMIGGRVMNAGSGRKQEAVGSGQIYIDSVRQCDCKYDFIDEERLREVEILAQGHTAKQRKSKARKADFCILKCSHTHTSGESSEQAPRSHHLTFNNRQPQGRFHFICILSALPPVDYFKADP